MTDWEEVLTYAFEEVGIEATADQIKDVAFGIQAELDNAAGSHDHTPQSQVELESLQAKIEKEARYNAETDPCPVCITRGTINDRWGRPTTCYKCNGKGRIEKRWNT